MKGQICKRKDILLVFLYYVQRQCEPAIQVQIPLGVLICQYTSPTKKIRGRWLDEWLNFHPMYCFSTKTCSDGHKKGGIKRTQCTYTLKRKVMAKRVSIVAMSGRLKCCSTFIKRTRNLKMTPSFFPILFFIFDFFPQNVSLQRKELRLKKIYKCWIDDDDEKGIYLQLKLSNIRHIHYK